MARHFRQIALGAAIAALLIAAPLGLMLLLPRGPAGGHILWAATLPIVYLIGMLLLRVPHASEHRGKRPPI